LRDATRRLRLPVPEQPVALVADTKDLGSPVPTFTQVNPAEYLRQQGLSLDDQKRLVEEYATCRQALQAANGFIEEVLGRAQDAGEQTTNLKRQLTKVRATETNLRLQITKAEADIRETQQRVEQANTTVEYLSGQVNTANEFATEQRQEIDKRTQERDTLTK